MAPESPFPAPAWLDDLPPEEQTRERIRFNIRLAALYATQDGTMQSLSLALGFKKSHLHARLATQPGVSAKTAIRIEKLLGRSVCPFETLIAVPQE